MEHEPMKPAVRGMEPGQDGAAGKRLTFWLGRQLFGIPISCVMQIIGMQPITRVPDLPAYCRGIIRLRGSVVPLIDLRLRFGMEAAADTERTCIIVCDIGGRGFGYIVDGVDEVVNVPGGRIAPPPQMGQGAANRYLTGIARLEEGGACRLALLVDAGNILGPDESARLAKNAGEWGG